MKKVDVYVPLDYDVPSSMFTENAHNVITVGDIMYNRCDDIMIQNNPEHARRVDEERTKHHVEMEVLRKKLEMSDEQHRTQVKHFMDMNASLQRQIQQSYEDKAKLSQELSREKEELKDRQIESNHEIIQKIDSLFGSGNAIDNIEKGNFGEEYVCNTITHEFPEATVDDVSGETAHCDWMWKMDSNSFRCLVEVKNVAQGRNLNVEKFVRDMNINIANGEANCGMFVSLKTETIPNKGRVKLEYIQNSPVIYVSGVWKNPIVLQYTLRMMKHIQQHNDAHARGDVIHVQEFVTKTYNTIAREQSHINELRKLVDRMNLLIQKSQKNLSESLYYIEANMVKHGIELSDGGCADYENHVDAIVQYRATTGRWPLSSKEVNLSQHINKNMTFKNLLQAAKEKAQHPQ